MDVLTADGVTVGPTAAVFPARHGVVATIVERQPGPSGRPRAIGSDPGSRAPRLRPPPETLTQDVVASRSTVPAGAGDGHRAVAARDAGTRLGMVIGRPLARAVGITARGAPPRRPDGFAAWRRPGRAQSPQCDPHVLGQTLGQPR